jgi:hypothetical protein
VERRWAACRRGAYRRYDHSGLDTALPRVTARRHARGLD